MKSTNPVFRNPAYAQDSVISEQPMTINGTLNKLFLLSSIFTLSAAIIWYKFSLGQLDFVNLLTGIGGFVGLALAMIIAFVPKTAPFLSPFYALTQGIILSSISCSLETIYPGIVVQAVSITFLTLFVMFFCYKFKIIEATQTYKKVLFIATGSIFLFYLISTIAMFFFKANIPYFQNSSDPFSIILNLGIAIVAALNLIIDFDFIEQAEQRMLPKYFEWYGAFGLLVTVFWLYIEILRLIARFASKRN